MSPRICPFLAVRLQFDSVHHQNRRLSSHSYSHESVIFWINIVQVTASLLFLSLKCMRLPLLQPLQTKRCGSVHYITIGDSRLRTVLGCGTRSPLYLIGYAASRRGLCTYLIGYAASRRGLCTGRVFHPAQRPVERAPA